MGRRPECNEGQGCCWARLRQQQQRGAVRRVPKRSPWTPAAGPRNRSATMNSANKTQPNAGSAAQDQHRQPATGKFWASLGKVNGSVNAQVRPRTDMEMWGKEEVWSFPAEFGDCEDYVIEKRRRLMAMGIPAGNLLITVLRQQNGDGHAVLTVRTTAARLCARQSGEPHSALEQHRIHLSEAPIRARIRRVAVDQ